MFLENSSRGAYRRALRCFEDFEANVSLHLESLNWWKQESRRELLLTTKIAFVGIGLLAMLLRWGGYHVAWVNNHGSIFLIISVIIFLVVFNAVIYTAIGLLFYIGGIRELNIFNRLVREIESTKLTSPESLEDLKAEYAKEVCR